MKPDLQAILRVLAAHEVEFIVVGGVCAVLHGAPVTTFDLDVVHSRSRESVVRLRKALEALDARYRMPMSASVSSRPRPGNAARSGTRQVAVRVGDKANSATNLRARSCAWVSSLSSRSTLAGSTAFFQYIRNASARAGNNRCDCNSEAFRGRADGAVRDRPS